MRWEAERHDPTNPPTKNKPTNPPTKNQPANQPTNPHSNNPKYIKEYVQMCAGKGQKGNTCMRYERGKEARNDM